jgi:hypothetical protein
MRVIDGSTLKTSDDFRVDIESKQELLVVNGVNEWGQTLIID